MGPVKLNEVSHADVQAWASALGASRSASTAIKAHRVLSLVLALAVRDGRLVRNPADGIGLPRETQRDRHYLSHAEVAALADAAGADRALILVLAYTGLRFGELAALRVRRLDPARRRIEVAESVTSVNGALIWGTPKGHARRWVSIPRFVAAELGIVVAGRGPDKLVFESHHGGVLRSSNFRRDVFGPAAGASGLDGLVPHALRHTAASLAIAAGADVKVVQQMLGHKSATMTLDLYGHLFESRLDEVADRLDAAANAAVARPLPKPSAFGREHALRSHVDQQIPEL
jgi:integrase